MIEADMKASRLVVTGFRMEENVDAVIFLAIYASRVIKTHGSESPVRTISLYIHAACFFLSAVTILNMIEVENCKLQQTILNMIEVKNCKLQQIKKFSVSTRSYWFKHDSF